MNKTPFVLFGIFAAICVIVIPAWALSKEGSDAAAPVQVAAEDEETKEIFTANCGACHTLAAAGTTGVRAPNLDALLVPTGTNSASGVEGNYARVVRAIACGVPPGGGRMPKGILLGEEAKEVAAFVATYAGQIGTGAAVPTDEIELADPASCESSEPDASAATGDGEQSAPAGSAE